jgi:uncharacterized protein
VKRAGGRLNLLWRVALGWLAFVVALFVATSLGAAAETYLGASELGRQAIQAAVTTGIVAPWIYTLCRFGDRRPLRELGLISPASGLPYLLRGGGFAVVMAGAALGLGAALGWLRVVALDLSAATLLALLVEILLAFFFEAFPEELTFRGYLYRNLNTRLTRWLAVLTGVVLFVLAPVTLTTAQLMAGMEVRVGAYGAGVITADYVILLAGFGLVLQVLRVVTGSLWSSIGFHLTWLSLGPYVVGPGEGALVQVEDVVPLARDVVIFFLGPVVVGSLVLLAWPYLRKRPVGWRERDPDEPAGDVA